MVNFLKKILKLTRYQEEYYQVGKLKGIQKIVNRFYDLMESDPEVKPILDMHENMQVSREKLTYFLSGWFGGPPLYHKKYGHPRMRARHMRFKIGEKERDMWLKCMKTSLEENVKDENLREKIYTSMSQFADFMRNQ